MSDVSMDHPELGRKVEVGSIDAELHKLWSEDDARTNASLMNLAVYSEAEGALERNSAAVRELTREHACRALLIGMRPEAGESRIDAWITAHCHLSSGRKSVCCEQIAFSLTGRVTGRLRNTVFAHLNSDLPLIFWWQGELSPIFGERLYSLMDRLIFDSATWAGPRASFERIVEATETSKNLVVQDLSWTRTYQFRVSVAALFDDPVAQSALEGIESVEIVHHPGHRIAALQLLTWLVTQVGWEDGGELALDDVRGGDGVEGFAFETAAGSPVRAVLRSDAGGAALGRLTLTAGSVRVEVARAADARLLVRRLEAPGHRVEDLAPADHDDPVSLIGDQLSRGGKNSLFTKILARFLRLLERGDTG